MDTRTDLGAFALATCFLLMPTLSIATDTDGSADCEESKTDFGDAPEDIPAYAGVPGRFPTCVSPSGPGDQELAAECPAISTPPGPTGYVKHKLPGADPLNYWLGCHDDGAGSEMGIDSETDGKVNTPPAGFSFCASSVVTDCVAPAGPMWDQDECFLGGGLDAGLLDPVDLLTCHLNTVEFEAYYCDAVFGTFVFLNILLDMNHDGDWNDSFFCPGPLACAYEWAVKNSIIPLVPGCTTPIEATFMVGPIPEPGWMRITLTEFPVTDDFPWAGSVGLPGDQFVGGETEDYPRNIVAAVSAPESKRSTWGRVKSMYR